MDKIVCVSGYFDPIHVGHLEYIRLAKELGPNHTIVTILCDTSDKYRSKLFNKQFLTKKGLPLPQWL